MPAKLERRRRGRQPWVEPAEREWCVRRLQHDQVLPLGSLTYRQAALVIGLLSTVRFIMHADSVSTTSALHFYLSFTVWLLHLSAPSPIVADESIGLITVLDASLVGAQCDTFTVAVPFVTAFNDGLYRATVCKYRLV